MQSTSDFGLHEVYFTWAGTYVLEAATFLFPHINFILADADCIPMSLFEVKELIALCQHLYPELPRSQNLGAVILVSEPHEEIHAGWVCIGNRSEDSPLTHNNWQQLAGN